MKFFIDSADMNEIKQALSMGLIDGVTTNPSLIAKTGRARNEVIKEISQLVKGPISAEVISLEAEGMYKEGLELANINDNVVVKVPMTEDGLIATKKFSSDGIKTNVTLVFSAVQAMLAAKAGATMVSPFIGRIDDTSNDGMVIIEQIVKIFKNYNFKTEVLAASIRHPVHILQAAMLGADISTIPLKVIQQLAKHPLTDRGLEQFLNDHKKSSHSSL